MKPIQATFTLLAAATLLATQPGAGCVSDGSSGPSGPPDTGSSSSPGPISTSSSGSSTPDDSNRVPNRAEIVKEGRGVLEYTADADGTIWVQDVRREETIVSHRIHRGEKVRVAPDEDRVYLEGDSISKNDIKRDNAHRIYLEKDRRFDDRDDRYRDDDRNRADDRYRDDDRDNVAARGDGTKVPNGAELIGSGKGREVAVWIGRDGQVYVYDADAKKVAASVRVRAGDRLVFSPDDDRITLNGTLAVGRDFSTKTNYRVYQDR